MFNLRNARISIDFNIQLQRSVLSNPPREKNSFLQWLETLEGTLSHEQVTKAV
jgi:hypothetical protein